jgi:hypothetical protein
LLISGQNCIILGKTHSELYSVNYLKSHAQGLWDRTGAPDNLWFLAQDGLAHVHNLSANRQLNWKIPEQVSMEGDTRHTPYPDVSLV